MSEETQKARSTGVETRGETFTLTIELGNAAMREPEDVAAALQRVARLIGNDGAFPTWGHRIKDDNGNTVGSWSVR